MLRNSEAEKAPLAQPVGEANLDLRTARKFLEAGLKTWPSLQIHLFSSWTTGMQTMEELSGRTKHKAMVRPEARKGGTGYLLSPKNCAGKKLREGMSGIQPG
jgi:hypothetical protein